MELSKVGLLLAKLETTYGTDPTPAAADNNIAVQRGQVTLEIDGDDLDRDHLDAGFGKVAGAKVLPRCSLKFRTELRGNRTTGAVADISKGASANAVQIDALLQACNLDPTYTAESILGARDGAVLYKPTVPADEGKSVTFYFYSHGKLYKVTGAKGNIDNLAFEAGKFAFIDWAFNGRYNPVVDSTIPASPGWLATKPPLLQPLDNYYTAQAVTVDPATEKIALAAHKLMNGDLVKFGGDAVPTGLTAGTYYYVVNAAAGDFKVSATRGGTPVDITSAGTAVTITSASPILFDSWGGAVFSKCNIKLGNQVPLREDGNSSNGVKGFLITDRETTGDFDPESVKEAAHPIWTDWAAGKVKPMFISLGNQTGNRMIVQVKTRMGKVNYEDRNGRRIQNVAFAARGDVGDVAGADFSIEFK